MNIQRIVKQFAASAATQVIIFGQQILLTPIFIHSYGLASYGEWLTLSAAVAYLNTLQFGIQTYVNNELTMRYGRGEMDEYQVMQSTALRILLGTALIVTAAMTVVYFLPMNRWLHLSLSQPIVATAVFFLGLQMLANLPLNYFTGTYMVFGMAHRGITWQNVSRVMMIIVAATMAWLHTSFAAIAIGQFVVIVVYAALVLIDLRRLEPTIFPTLQHWDTAMARTILGPSAYFFLLFTCNFLVYQLPVILIQRMLGPVFVAAFNVMRTIFSMMRQGLSVFTNSISPEVTGLFGRREFRSLGNLYSLSERVLFAAIPPLNVTALLLAPVILRVWLHKPGLYDLKTYALMAMVSCAISVKDHKMIFQLSTNSHKQMATVAFLSYLGMSAVAFVTIPRFGLAGFLGVWFVVEAALATYALWLNARLLMDCGPVERLPAIKMAVLLPCAVWVACMVERHVHADTWTKQGAIAIAFGCVLLAISAWLFDLRHVLQRYAERRARRQAALAN